MSKQLNIPERLFITDGEPVLQALRRAVRHALLQHKRAGNTIATSEGGRVVLIPASEIEVGAESAKLTLDETTPVDPTGKYS